MRWGADGFHGNFRLGALDADGRVRDRAEEVKFVFLTLHSDVKDRSIILVNASRYLSFLKALDVYFDVDSFVDLVPFVVHLRNVDRFSLLDFLDLLGVHFVQLFVGHVFIVSLAIRHCGVDQLNSFSGNDHYSLLFNS